jgi:type VI secretion system protein VasJ
MNRRVARSRLPGRARRASLAHVVVADPEHARMTHKDAIAARARALLEPIPGGEPAGTNAAYDPRYDAVRTEIGKLDSVAGGTIDWAKVASGCQELLAGVTKDFLLASQQVVALLQLEQWTGLAVGLAVVEGMYASWWDAGFPPAARARARANALDWLVARLEIDLAARTASAEHVAAVDAARASWAAITEQSKARLGDLAPATSGVAAALDRVRASLPAGDAVATTPSQPASAPTVEPSATPAQPASVAAVEPNPSPSPPASPSDAPPANATAAEAPPVAAEPPPPPAAPADPLAEHLARAEAWLAPIPGAAPAGTEARYDPAYETARVEIAKQDSVTDNTVQWKLVLDNASSILKTKAKDVLMATYFAYAGLKHAGLPAFTDGLLVLHGMLDRYWEGMWPERLRGRANAMMWFVEQLDRALGEVKLEPKQRGQVLAMQKAVTRLATITRERMGHEGPSFGPVTERIQRMLMAVPEEKPPEPPAAPAAPQQPQPQATATPTPTPTPSAPAPAAVAAPSVAAPANAEAVTGYLQETGRNLITAANALREASRQDATAYRLLRVGLYLHLAGPPPAAVGGKSQIPPLAPAKRTQLQTLEANGKWEALVDECEGALPMSRFCFDLHRLTHRALDRLGDAFVGAKQAVVAELAAALSRMPGAVDMFARDGSPLSDGETKTWINDVVLAGAATGGSAGGGDAADDDAKVFAEVRALLTGGKAGDAMRIAAAKVDASTSMRQRVQRRMSLATALLESGQAMIARGMFAALERELREGGLFAWEPELASRCLEGFVRAIRAAAKAGARYEQADQVFERLCAVDPSAAARLAT